MVQYCPNTTLNLTVYSLFSNRTSGNFLYSCDAMYWNTGIKCDRETIYSLDCGGGQIVYYLVPTTGLYASREYFYSPEVLSI